MEYIPYKAILGSDVYHLTYEVKWYKNNILQKHYVILIGIKWFGEIYLEKFFLFQQPNAASWFT